MSPQDENARILFSHFQLKPEFFSGYCIANLCEIVERVLEPKPEYRPGFCQRCGNFREIAKPIGYETGDYEMLPCPECAL